MNSTDILVLQAHLRYTTEIRRHTWPARYAHVVRGLERFFETVAWNTSLGGLCAVQDLLLLFEDGNINDRLLDTVTNLLTSDMERCLSTRVFVADTNLPLVLSRDELWSSFATENQLKAVRNLTDRVLANEVQRIIFPVNVDRVHWAVFEVDIAGRCIRYGDSLGWPVWHRYCTNIIFHEEPHQRCCFFYEGLKSPLFHDASVLCHSFTMHGGT
jgi:hypothetical protein